MNGQSTDDFIITFLDNDAQVEGYTNLQAQQILPFAASGLFHPKIKTASYITKGADVRRVVDIILNVEGLNIEYEPGDTIGIIPKNSATEVDGVISKLGCGEFADVPYSLSAHKKRIPLHVPVIGTIREVLTNNLCLRSPPKKIILKALVKYTSSNNDLEKLNELCTKSSSYIAFISNECTSLLDLLNAFPSARPPFALLLEHLPRLQPRPYSIANSPKNGEGSEMRIAFSLIENPNNTFGVCTGWLHNLINVPTDYENSHKIILFQPNEKIVSFIEKSEETTIPIYLRKPSDFRLPSNPKVPLLLICAGTGIAPFIAFLQHRLIQRQQEGGIGDIWLFFGNRYASQDFLFRVEVETFLNTGVLTRLFTAFSRDGSEHKYVQDCIKANAQEFVNMIFVNQAMVFVCGNKNMCNGVKDVIVDVISTVNECTSDFADVIVKNLQADKKYLADVWN